MARGNQKERAREKNLKAAGNVVSFSINKKTRIPYMSGSEQAKAKESAAEIMRAKQAAADAKKAAEGKKAFSDGFVLFDESFSISLSRSRSCPCTLTGRYFARTRTVISRRVGTMLASYSGGGRIVQPLRNLSEHRMRLRRQQEHYVQLCLLRVSGLEC
ncbi:hypothetical protein KCU93_g174, partial [Aureobasidium melanogenum]